MMHGLDIGYGAINHPVDNDPVCGYTGVIRNECPNCGRNNFDEIPFDSIQRITGYLTGTLNNFNNAKKAEVKDRVKHTEINFQIYRKNDKLPHGKII